MGTAVADGSGRIKWLLTRGGGLGVCDGRDVIAEGVTSSEEVAERFGWPEPEP